MTALGFLLHRLADSLDTEQSRDVCCNKEKFGKLEGPFVRSCVFLTTNADFWENMKTDPRGVVALLRSNNTWWLSSSSFQLPVGMKRFRVYIDIVTNAQKDWSGFPNVRECFRNRVSRKMLSSSC